MIAEALRTEAAPAASWRGCSPWLFSAFLVLLGGYLLLHDAQGRPTSVDLTHVLATQLAYAAALLDGVPLVGLMLAATHFQPALVDATWAHRIPLTPFWLALLLAVPVTALRARARHDAAAAHLAVFLAALALLGGDLPEVLARLRFPAAWQAVAITLACWSVIWMSRAWRPSFALHGLVAFVVASALEPKGLPWVASFVVLLAWGGFLLAARRGVRLATRHRLALVGAMAIVPALALAPVHDAPPRLLAAALSCVALAVVGWRLRDGLVLAGAVACLTSSAAIVATAVQHRGDIQPGRLLIELGFLVLLLAVLETIAGTRIRAWLAALRDAPAERSRA